MAWLNINFQSDALQMPVMLEVYLPQGRGGYRQLYLLHGAGGDHASWGRNTRLSDYAEQKNIAVIMSSGNNKCYVNNLYGKDYFTFVTEELIQKCETWFHLSPKRENRSIAGMSMGGYGAVYAGLQRPDLYGTVFSYSGLLDIYERFQKPEGLDLLPVFGKKEEFCTEKYDLFTLVHNFKNKKPDFVENATHFYLTCGKQDKRLHMTEQLYEEMKKNQMSVSMHLEDGEHNWQYWDTCIQKTMAVLSGDTSWK